MPIVNVFSYIFSLPLFLYLRYPQKHPYLKQLSNYRFKQVHAIVLDQLIPKIANYWKRGEVLNLFKNKNLKKIKIYRVNDNSWTILGTKK